MTAPAPQAAPGVALFDTALGACGIAWSPLGLGAVALPAASRALTLAHVSHLAQRCGTVADAEAEPPGWVAAVVERIRALLSGQRIGFDDVPLDETGIDTFRRNVHALARAIPAGETRTYGDLARRLGDVRQARAVGQALGANPFPIVVPCHRVLAAQGRSGGFSAPGGLSTKLRLLEIERAAFGDTRSLFD